MKEKKENFQVMHRLSIIFQSYVHILQYVTFQPLHLTMTMRASLWLKINTCVQTFSSLWNMPRPDGHTALYQKRYAANKIYNEIFGLQCKYS